MKKWLLLALLFITSPAFSSYLSDADKLFDLLEQQQAGYFYPPNQKSQQTQNGWYYRYYPESKRYLGVKHDVNVYMGEAPLNDVVFFGKVQDLLKQLSTKSTVIPDPKAANWEWYTERKDILANMSLSDAGKQLLVATNGGVEQFDTESGKLLKILTSEDGLDNFLIRAVERDDSGGSWIATDKTLTHIDSNGQLTRYTMDDVYPGEFSKDRWTSLLKDSEGGLWAGTSNGLVHLSKNGDWTIHLRNNDPFLLLFGEGIYSLKSDGKNGVYGLWVKKVRWTICLFHLNSNGNYKEKVNYKEIDHADLEIDSVGQIWIMVKDDPFTQLSYLDINNNWNLLTSDNSNLPETTIHSIAADNNGGLWISTDLGLVYRDKNGHWTEHTSENSRLLENLPAALEVDKHNTLWIKSSHYLSSRNEKGEWKSYYQGNTAFTDLPGIPRHKQQNDLNKIFFKTVDIDGGQWFMTGRRELTYISPQNKKYIFPIEEVLGDIDMLKAAPSGGILVSWTQRNFFTFEHISGITQFSTKGIFQGKWEQLVKVDGSILDFESDQFDGIWFGTSNFGLYYIDPDGQLTNYTITNSSLVSNEIHALFLDDKGGLWILNDTTLIHSDLQGPLKIFTSDNSVLPGNDVIEILEDDHKGLWVVTKNGLSYRSNKDIWFTLTHENSDMPFDSISDVISDGKGGLWLFEHNNSAAHLSFNSIELSKAANLLSDKNPSPLTTKTIYHNGDEIEVILPPLPVGQTSYVAIQLTDNSLYAIEKLENGFLKIEDHLPPWLGNEEVMKVSVTSALQRGLYTLFLLHVPEGVDPLQHPEQWLLGRSQFVIE